MPITLKLLALWGGRKHLRSWNVCQNRLFHSLEIKVFAAIVTGYRLECFPEFSLCRAFTRAYQAHEQYTLDFLLSILRIISIPFERSVITISADFVSACPPLYQAPNARKFLYFRLLRVVLLYFFLFECMQF